MMHESPPLLQCYKPIIEIMALSKKVVILHDDDALIQNSFVGLMEFCLDGFMELQTFHITIQFLDVSSWQVFIDEEYASLLRNGIWELMPLAQHHKFSISQLSNKKCAKFVHS
jgi:hypothetical protein